ncbi:YciI family protein [Dongia sedimenti]|uniref:YciI family protein n=1 Tax=Dongia sedimenti TaxID=3064282 RepID=A0ABU0YIZ3_9PROT|nr:YciI family protein [Rhodospirillaceae bacterium R-7]
MRFMMIVIPKGYESAPADAMPDAETVGAMDKYNNALLEAGVVLAMEGLHPPSTGVRVTFPGGKPVVKDGPFPEAKEVVGGFWMIDVKSKAEAIKWAKKCPGGDDMTIEIRQVQEWEDFTPEVKAAAKHEPKIRKALEKKRKKTVKKVAKKKK